MSATPCAGRQLTLRTGKLTVPALFLADVRDNVLELQPRLLVQALHPGAQLEHELEPAVSGGGGLTAHASAMNVWEKAGVSGSGMGMEGVARRKG